MFKAKLKSTADTIRLLEKSGELARIDVELDPNLEIPLIQRMVFAAGGPALFFTKVKDSPFAAVSNLYGTKTRAELILSPYLNDVKALLQLKANPSLGLRHPTMYLKALRGVMHALPLPSFFRRPVAYQQIEISSLPQIKSWPKDGGPFITLPQVYTQDLTNPGVLRSNMGMYRVQLGGNRYMKNREIGLHYQIHRGIGIHHTQAIEAGRPLPVSIFVGGHPAHAFSAVMPLPEGLPEIAFAGVLAGRNFRYFYDDEHLISTDADFVITGEIVLDQLRPEGPFGDHLGYYSLKHDYPVMQVKKVYARKNAIWPFTVVGRPPQEDTVFGELIHEITLPMVPVSIPGVRAVHAVDAAGVHPLLLAIGSERYTPYEKARVPREVLTQANAILGFNQMSLAKYLMIISGEDVPNLDINNIQDYFFEILRRADFSRDLHFQTKTTIDTLDYSGTGHNQGSKLVLAAAGEIKRELSSELSNRVNLPQGFYLGRMAMPGVLVMPSPKFHSHKQAHKELQTLSDALKRKSWLKGIALIVLVDDADFVTADFNNFLWVTFTRSNPSHDVYGIDSFIEHKHFGCHGPLVIDARLKPHHAPPLEDDPAVVKRVKKLAEKGGPLYGVI